MFKKAQSPLILIAVFLVIGGALLVSTTNLSNSLTGMTTAAPGGTKANLIVFDTYDLLYSGDPGEFGVGVPVKFYANYSNLTTGRNISNADCIINFTDLDKEMTFNDSSHFFELSRNFSLPVYNLAYNISCNVTDYEQLNVTDELITANIYRIRNSKINLTRNVTAYTAMDIRAPNVTVECNGFSILSSVVSAGYGVITANASLTVNHCNLIDFGYPFDIDLSTNGKIINTNVTNAGAGIGNLFDITNSANFTIENVTIMNSASSPYEGISLSNSPFAKIKNLHVLDIAVSDDIVLLLQSPNVTISNSVLTPTSCTNLIGFSQSADCSLTNSVLTNSPTDVAIKIEGYSNRLFINKNNLTDIAWGIDVAQSDYINISNNIIRNITASFSYGISFYNSDGSTISNNTIGPGLDDRIVGISFEQTNDMVVSGNTLFNMYRGIELSANSAADSIVSGNNITNASNAGIYASGHGVDILGNEISDSGTGIYITGSDVMLTNNIFSNNGISLNSPTQPFDIAITNQNGSVKFNDVIGAINDVVNNVHVAKEIISVNSLVEPKLSTFASNITFNLTGSCPTKLVYSTKFTHNVAAALRNGALCDASTDPACVAITCIGNIATFNVPHFDTYAAGTTTNSSVVVESTFKTNLTTENLTAYWVTIDPAPAPVVNISDWRLNGRSIAILNAPFEKHAASATRAIDYSKASHNLTVHGAVWEPNGYLGGGYVFDDFSDSINTSTVITSNVATYGAWINFSDLACPGPGGNYCTPISQDDTGANGYELYVDPTGNLGCQAGPGVSSSTFPVVVGKWYYVLCRHNGAEVSLFVNGQQIGTPVVASGAPTATQFKMGPGDLYGSPGDYGFKGIMDEVVVYNRALSDEQIYELYRNKTNTIVSQETDWGERWSDCMTVVDVNGDETARCSPNLRIANDAPAVSNVVLDSTFSTNLTNENLTVTWNSTDPEGDRVTNTTDWRIDGKSIAVLNMPFESDAANNTRDYSTWQNNGDGTAVGATFMRGSGYKNSDAFYFNAGSYVEVPDSPSLSLLDNFSISLWVNVSDYGNYRGLVSKTSGAYAAPFDSYLATGTGLVTFLRGSYDPLDSCSASSNTAVPMNKWALVSIVYSYPNVSFYLNGELDGTTPCPTAALDWNQPVRIGSRSDGGTTFVGFMDDVKIYNRTLSPQQIKAIYRNETDKIVSQETEAGQTWKACVTPNDGVTNGATVCSNNLTIVSPTTPPVDTGGRGGGNPPADTTPVPDTTPPAVTELPAEPVTETPAPVETTSIVPSQISKSQLACSQNATTQSVTEAYDYSKQVSPGYELLVNPFKLDCKSPSAKLTFSVPDSYTNITALKCVNGKCGPIGVQTTTELTCGAKIFDDVTRKTNMLTPDLFPIEIIHSEINKAETKLSSGSTQIEFAEKTNGKVTLDKMLTAVPEAKNARIRITGTPIELTFEAQQTGSAVITLPYVVPEHVDESSTAIYILNKSNDKWVYVGGDIVQNQKTVSVSVPNIEKYIQNDKLIIAPMSLICLNCFDAKLEKVYDGGSKDAVVLVHGFENTPERFEDIINDIKLTQQPWQVWTLGYPSNLPIEDTGKDFADLLQLNAKDSDFVYIVAHSMGGLVTQQALRYAYEQNQGKSNPPYTFVNKVIKVVLIATPNQGALSKDPSNIFNSLLNADTLAGLFNVKSKIISDLISGKEIKQVPGIQYLVIAGTQSYGFSKFLGLNEKNDGLVTVSSAQTIGGQAISNSCHNFWAINSTHTNILNNYDSRKLVEKIVATEVAKDVSNKALMGHSQYFDLDITSCTPNEQYIIIGAPLKKEAIPDPGLCSCGNGVCGADETDVNCPNDCAKLEKPKSSLLDLLLHFAPLRNLTLGLIVVVTLIVLLSRRRKPTMMVLAQVGKEIKLEKEPVHEEKPEMKQIEKGEPVFDVKMERRLNDLLLQTRIALRTGKLNGATTYYAKFNSEYSQAPTKLKEKFKEVANKLREEVKRKLI